MSFGGGGGSFDGDLDDIDIDDRGVVESSESEEGGVSLSGSPNSSR